MNINENRFFDFHGVIEEKELSQIHHDINDLLEAVKKGVQRIEFFYNNKAYLEFSKKENLNEYETLQISFSYAIVTGLNSAKLLADKGLVLESFILSRSTLETIYLLEYLTKKPSEANDIWNSTFYNAPSEALEALGITEKLKNFSFKKFIPSVLKDDLSIVYNFLCKFSHPTAWTYHSYSNDNLNKFQRDLIILNYYMISELIIRYIESQLEVGQFIDEQRQTFQLLIKEINSVREKYEPYWLKKEIAEGKGVNNQ